ncbi:calcium-binding protein [Paracoccus sp. IB05]|uniref:calcium-binding protein n=1 Tax=Paracoccus sp. IB05 TaxID=2779367 RepID=UPI0018E878A4|nr:calcium-binding protein [Paracoccus sp. IB05]MBJ2150474.1 hypothetical protein [Paracoccus sp. IB05]
MPFILGTTSIGSGVRYTLSTGDSLLIQNTATVFSDNDVAIRVSGDNARIFVQGSVAGTTAIGTGYSSYQSGTYVHVLPGASVIGTAVGLSAYGSQGYFLNEGTVTGGETGVALSVLSDAPGGTLTFVNHGSVSGYYYGLGWQASGSGTSLTIFNTGTIFGGSIGVRAPFLTATTLRNSGEITGGIDLSSVNDVFDNRNGVLNGTAFGNSGNDVFIGNPSQSEIFNGGTGVDLLDFRYSNGSVIVALDLSRPNAGQALGDLYYQFENIFGSQQNDILTGDNGNNVLTGEDGTDWLHGRGGNDLLRGGLGADTMAGGLGNDIFQYLNPGEGGDTIMDFANVAANNDAFQFSAAGFGGGLTAGALAAAAFQAGTTNVAATADVRFMHRITDNSIWYDADGNGAGAAVLIATLQGGVTGAALTHADFLIF